MCQPTPFWAQYYCLAATILSRTYKLSLTPSASHPLQLLPQHIPSPQSLP